MAFALAVAAYLALSGAWRWRRLSRCQSCEPTCPNDHQYEIVGNQSVVFASVAIALAGLASLAMT